MEHHTKHNFESDILKLLGMEDKHVIWLELRCAYDETPTVKCEYEVQDGDNPLVRDNAIVTEKKKYKIVLEEIEEEK
jgi:hypothetical protein